ncbi:MAG TPA: hypothetical protein VE464_09835, partial [Streptosporangiaceae bacterium]|nr:hypothetical protein [Streptosporangiaceae bacterium]
MAGVAATGTVEAGTVEAGTVDPGLVQAGPVEAAGAGQDRAGPADTTTATGIPGPGTLSAEAPVGPIIAAHPGSLPVIPAQAAVADAESGGVPPDDPVPAEAAAPEPDQPAPDQPAADQPEAAQPEADEATPAALATDQPELALEYSPDPPATALPTGMSEDAGPLGLVQIGAEPDHAAWPEDPWLPGSRRPDRRALIIGVVLIAGLLSVASTAWLVKVDSTQASSPHGTHRTQPSRLGSGHAQPSQALSGQPTPILAQPSQPQPSQPLPTQPAPTQIGTGPARTVHTGHSQPGHNQPGHNQSSGGHPGTSRSGTGHSHPGQPGASQTGTHRSGSGQPGPGQTGQSQTGPGQTEPGQGSSQNGSGQNKSGQNGTGQGKPGQSGPGQAGSGSSGTGHSGTGRGATPTAPHPRRSAPGSRGGGAPRHPRPGLVSITPGLAGRPDARRVGALLVRYFAAVNHRQYQAYASLFAQQHRLTPRHFAWGYQTSHDSNAVLVGIAALKGGLKATVTFTSYQDPAQSPDHSSCIDWRITLFLHRTGATY